MCSSYDADLAAAAIGGAVVAVRFAAILVTEGAYAYPSAHTMVYKTPTDMGLAGKP